MKLIKSDHFGGVAVDVYSQGDDLYMTALQLCACLEETKGTFDSRLSRKPQLRGPEFSGTCKLQAPDGKWYTTRVFNEDGIYEIAMLSESPRGAEFRSYIRKLLKALRKGEVKVVSMTEYQQMMAETRRRNASIRSALILERTAKAYKGTPYAQVLHAYATKELTGQLLLPLPDAPRDEYTATQIGEMLGGVSSNKVGTLAKTNGLKTDQYGRWCADKSPHSSKEVRAFRYYDNVIPVLRELLDLPEPVNTTGTTPQ